MLLARGGIDSAFDELVRRHQARVMSVAARLLGRAEHAPDVAQDSFVAIYRGLASYQPKDQFPAYLYRVVLNHCRMAHRAARAEQLALGLAAREQPDGPQLSDSLILARERQREVEMTLQQLSPKLRVVAVLRYSADLSYDEIAEALDLPVGTVKRRLFDAMAQLRRRLGDR